MMQFVTISQTVNYVGEAECEKRHIQTAYKILTVCTGDPMMFEKGTLLHTY